MHALYIILVTRYTSGQKLCYTHQRSDRPAIDQSLETPVRVPAAVCCTLQCALFELLEYDQ